MPKSYKEVKDLLEAAERLCFIVVTSDPNEDLPGDYPMAVAYIDDELIGWEKHNSESIVVSTDNTNWTSIRERIHDIIFLAQSHPEMTYVLLDWNRTLKDDAITARLTALWDQAQALKIKNLILPPRIMMCSE